MEPIDLGGGLLETSRLREAADAARALNGELRTLTRTGGTFSVSMDAAFSTLQRNLSRLRAALTPVASVGVRLLNQVVLAVRPAAQGLANVLYTLFGARWAGVTDTLTEAGTAANKAASSTKKLAEAQRSLLGFDEIERLNSSSGSTSSGGSGSAGSSAGSGGSTVTLETVEWVQRLKEALAAVWEPFEQAWKKKGNTVLESARTMLISLRGVIAQVGKDWLAVWQGGAGQSIAEHLLGTVSELALAAAGLADGFREAWVHAGNGTTIVTALLGIVDTLAATLENLAAATRAWAEGLDLTGLLGGFAALSTALQPLAALLSGALAWGYQNVLLPLAGWVIEDAAPAALNALAGAAELLTGALSVLAAPARTVWDEFLAPVAAWTGGAAADLLTVLGDALDWCGEQLLSLSRILENEGSFLSKMEAVGGWLVDGLKSGVTGGLAGIGTWLYTWFVEPIVSGVKALFGIASPSTVFAEIGGFLVSGLCSGITGGLAQAWGTLSQAWEGLKGHFTDITVGVYAAVKTTWEQVKGTWAALMERFQGKTVSVGVTIRDTAESLWQSFRSGWVNKALSVRLTWTTSGLSALQQAVSKLLFGGRGWPKLAFAARGGVFSSPTLTMLGEAGTEAVVPLENNTAWMDALARRIAAQVSGSTGGGAQTITVQCVLDGRVIAENTIAHVNRETRRTGVHPLLAGI